MKKRLLMIIICIFCSLFCLSCEKGTKAIKTFPELVNDMKSYKLTGKLETYFPSGTKESTITVYFQKDDHYRVEILLPNEIEKQIIIKNNDGVFVLIPSLNKTFKVSSSWPLTSSFPYLLQSLSKDIISDKDIEKTEGKETTTYKLKANLFNDARNTYQKITFNNKSGLPTNIELFRDDNTPISKFTITSIESNVIIDKDMFENNISMQTLSTLYEENPKEYDRAMSYPTYCPYNLMLKEEVITGTKDDKRILLTYNGESNLTILETFVKPLEEHKTKYCNSSVYIFGDILAFVNDSTVEFYYDGIDYSLYSIDIDKLELAMIGASLLDNMDK